VSRREGMGGAGRGEGCPLRVHCVRFGRRAVGVTYREVVDGLEAFVGELEQKAGFAHTCKAEWGREQVR
jgi:hypothetical protein